MYWIKFLVWTLLSVPFAIAFESVTIKWLPSWMPVGCTLSGSTLAIMLLACAGRFADGASTIIALQAPFLAESAPSLGPSPDIRTLSRLVIIQVMAIVIVTLCTIEFANVQILRVVLLVITLVSFCASISNIILWAHAKTSSVRALHQKVLAQKEYDSFKEDLPRLEQILDTLEKPLDWKRGENSTEYFMRQRVLLEEAKRRLESFGVKLAPWEWEYPKNLRKALHTLLRRHDDIPVRKTLELSLLSRDSDAMANLGVVYLSGGKVLANILSVPASVSLVALISIFLPSYSMVDETIMLVSFFAVWYMVGGRI